MALVPKLVSYIGHYTVKEGDSVDSIAKANTGCWCRYGELIGANPQKPLIDVPGLKFKVFASLIPGEKLNVPSTWVKSAPMVGVGLSLQQHVMDISLGFPASYDSILAGVSDQVKAQIGAWWPYLGMGVNAAQNLPANPSLVTDANLTAITSLIASATAYVALYGSDPSMSRGMSWNAVPWTSVQTYLVPEFGGPDKQAAGKGWSALISLLANTATTGITQTPNGGGLQTRLLNEDRGVAGDLANGQLNLTERQSGMGQAPPLYVDQVPNFFDATTWTKSPFNELDAFGAVDTAAAPLSWDTLDPATLACIQANTGVMQKIIACQDCYTAAAAGSQEAALDRLKVACCHPELACWCHAGAAVNAGCNMHADCSTKRCYNGKCANACPTGTTLGPNGECIGPNSHQVATGGSCPGGNTDCISGRCINSLCAAACGASQTVGADGSCVDAPPTTPAGMSTGEKLGIGIGVVSTAVGIWILINHYKKPPTGPVGPVGPVMP